MPATLLIRAIDSGHRADVRHLKGFPIEVKDEPWNWGSEERLPSFIRVTCDTVTADQIRQYIQEWRLDATFSIVAQNASGWRIQMDVANVPATGFADHVRDKIQSYILVVLGGAIVSHTYNQVVFDVPKPDGTAEEQTEYLQDKQREIESTLGRLSRCRWIFKESGVDAVINAGGTWNATLAQLQNNLVDRLG